MLMDLPTELINLIWDKLSEGEKNEELEKAKISLKRTNHFFYNAYWEKACEEHFQVRPNENAKQFYDAFFLIEFNKKQGKECDANLSTNVDYQLAETLLKNYPAHYPYNAEILYYLARLHLTSKWENKQETIGLAYLEQAANQNEKRALKWMGEIYRDGNHRYKPNADRALTFFQKSYEKGHKEVGKIISDALENGCGAIKPDNEKLQNFLNSVNQTKTS